MEGKAGATSGRRGAGSAGVCVQAAVPYSRLHGGGGCLKAEHVLFGEPAIRIILCKQMKQKERVVSASRTFTKDLQLAEEALECIMTIECA